VVLDEQFAAVKRDVKQLYEDKLALHQQLAAATAESKAAEETVANYRRGMVDLLDV
jgi:cell division protein FtsB